MSIILGYKKKDKIYLAADNRVTNKKDNSFSDKNNKIITINDSLAMVCSGSRFAQDRFTDFMKNKDTSKWTIEDMKFNLGILCASLDILDNQDINNAGAYFIVGGLDKNKDIMLWSASWNRKIYDGDYVELALYPPEDIDMETCCNIFIPNLHEHFSVFMKKTIKEVAERSKMVSPSGDIWTYDRGTRKNSLEHFS